MKLGYRTNRSHCVTSGSPKTEVLLDTNAIFKVLQYVKVILKVTQGHLHIIS